LVEQFERRLLLFVNDSENQVLKNHALIGDYQGYKSFSVTGDVRVIYRDSGGQVFLIDIGTHNQVYN
jgi:addiction module RelE/StbE family toxin